MLKKELRTKMIRSALHHYKCLRGMERQWKGNTHLIEMFKKVEIWWMGGIPHQNSHISSKKLLCRWRILSITFAYVNNKKVFCK